MAPDEDKTQTYMPLTSGTMVSHYRIVERIGSGGMGEVYLAEDTKLHRKVALKFLPLHLCQDSECRARFTREAEAAAQLDHPNIVAVHEVGEYQGRPYFSMQHVEGRSLREVIAGKTLPLDRIIEIGIQVCDGLQAAHEKNIIHRDIKPSNILIDSHGRARIVDFGLASVMGTNHLTKTGSTLGTIGYMSPEQVRGETVDHRTDLFSLGVALYELITGYSPFKCDTEAATVHAITDTNLEPLARFRREVPPGLQTIIDKALEKDVAIRYQHADDLATDLKRLTSLTKSIPVSPKHHTRMIVSSIITVLVIIAALVLRPWRIVSRPSDQAVAAANSIAVVPFRNQTGDASLDPLGKMVSDWTTQGLSETGLGDVLSQDLVIRAAAGGDLRLLTKEAGATIIVTGSYYRVGDSLQFQTQIQNADAKLLQTIEPIYCSISEVMDGVSLVRQKVMGATAILLDRYLESGERPATPPTYEAYREWVQGSDLHHKGEWLGAAQHFLWAFQLDSTYWAAALSACAAYDNAGMSAQEDSLLQYLTKRRDHMSVLNQLMLDSKAAVLAGDKRAALDIAQKRAQLFHSSSAFYEWGLRALNANHPRECIQALESIDPNRGSMRGWTPYWGFLAFAYYRLGDYTKALAVVLQGRTLYPTDILLLLPELAALAALGKINEIHTLITESLDLPAKAGYTPGVVMQAAGIVLHFYGHEEDAMSCFERSIAWYKGLVPEKRDSARTYQAMSLYYGRRFDEAKDLFLQLVKETPADADLHGWLGIIAARQGDREAALKVSEWLKSDTTPHMRALDSYEQARIAATLGDKDEAVSLLRESFDRGLDFAGNVFFDPAFESLWDYPPYTELMKPKG